MTITSLVVGFIVIAGLVLALGYWIIVAQNAQPLIQSLPWIGWSDVFNAVAIVALVGVVLSIVPTLLATRKYLRI